MAELGGKLVRFPNQILHFLHRHDSQFLVCVAGVLKAEPVLDRFAAVISHDYGQYGMDKIGPLLVERRDGLDTLVQLFRIGEARLRCRKTRKFLSLPIGASLNPAVVQPKARNATTIKDLA